MSLGVKTLSRAAAIALALALPFAAARAQIATTPEGSLKPTYAFAVTGVTPAATPTDWLTLCGGGGKEVHLTRIEISGLATTAGDIDVVLVKRTAADSGGTATAQTPAKWRTTGTNQQATPAATATLSQYTANPSSLGAGIAIASVKLALPVAGTAPPVQVWDFNRDNEQDMALLSANDCVAVNLNGDTQPSGAALNASLRWTEW